MSAFTLSPARDHFGKYRVLLERAGAEPEQVGTVTVYTIKKGAVILHLPGYDLGGYVNPAKRRFDTVADVTAFLRHLGEQI